MIIGSFYFYVNDFIRFELDDIKKIKNLKSKRVKSSYIDNVMVWENTTNEICLILNVYARLCKIPQDFIRQHKIKPYHISLIRKMYFDYEQQKTYLNFKRPYGNSCIFCDIAEEYLKYKKNNLKYDSEWINHNIDILKDIHNKTMYIFDQMLKELMINSTEYVSKNKQSKLNDWIPTKKGLYDIMKMKRKIKLKKIIY